ncbi:hypothetical protein RvY_03316 [Ramazzottius varieornatus]|uniref:Uncharacterized protein n=1 Tax=Ramazzottius varieornatus TaxID=947166 RepID=A0A1D1UX15_RAMVA|nr:hypothetical protein RvY_03316 [Ramazzottius varieornatus]
MARLLAQQQQNVNGGKQKVATCSILEADRQLLAGGIISKRLMNIARDVHK